MPVEFSAALERSRLSPISWAAIFASLAVGISVMLLLTLAGFAIGLSVVDPGSDSPRVITISAAAWQTLSMLIAAVVGGYVAARLSGLRRTGDGVLHGAVSWGATTLLYAALATTALGTLTAGMFGLLAPAASEKAAPTATSTATIAHPEQAQRALENMGISAEQAGMIIRRLNAPVAGSATPPARPHADDVAESVGTATGWLSATVLLSLVLSMIGGAMGPRGTRRTNRRSETRKPASAMNPVAPTLGRQI